MFNSYCWHSHISIIFERNLSKSITWKKDTIVTQLLKDRIIKPGSIKHKICLGIIQKIRF